MQSNYWKIGVILLSILLIGGVLFFLMNNSSEERPFSGEPNSSQTKPRIPNTELNGEIFVVTQGSGNIKLGLAEVVVENQATKQIFKATTNADGKFSIVVPAGDYLVNANSVRTYQVKSYRDYDKEMLDKNLINKSLGETYRLYRIAIIKKDIELVSKSTVQISEYCNWKFSIKLNQSKQSLQLSNNNLTDFGIKK